MENIPAADVVWICTLLNQITDTQWNDVFSHAAIPPDKSTRYIRKIKSKINEGLKLDARTSNRP
jgi:hypothetical protein